MEVDGILRIFNRSEKLHNLKYSNYIGDGDTKTFNALSENKPYGDDYLIQKIECVGHVQKRMGTRLRKLKLIYSKKKFSDGKTIGGKGRLTDSLIDKLAHYYGNAIRCNSTSVKEMRKAIWAVWGHSCSTDDEPMHWFCPTNPNTWWIEHVTGPPAPNSSKTYGPRIKDAENPHHTVTFGECSGTGTVECGLSVSQIRQL
ncbi:uncharacterized protein TNCV_206881 [Trichonephila clavipes]|nr:uncharacterized protein TNCV_206881 [Trichonephila clavipes]